MPVGILQSRSALTPPGTCLLEAEDLSLGSEASRLKRDPKRPDIILQPQPSASSVDPLNFARWRKELLFLILMIGSVLTGVIGPVFVPAFGLMSVDLGVPVPKIAALNGILLLGEGVASMIFIISSALYGRRHAYLACTILSVVSCIWAAVSPDYNTLYGARFFQGVGMAAYAVLLGSTITDLFFVHQHGVRIAWWQVTYCASVNIAPILSSIIVDRSGDWRTVFWVMTAFEAAVLIGVVFGCPETMYNRRITPTVAEEDKYTTEHLDEQKTGASTPSRAEAQPQSHHVQDSLTFAQSLKVFTRIEQTESLFTVVARPFAVFFAPHIFYATLTYTICFAWFVMSGATYVQMYGPGGMYYQESITTVGVVAGVAPMIGTLAACIISGPLTDYSARWLSGRNHGVFEPEFRLVVLLPAAVCIAIGGFGWAWTVGPGYSYLVSTSIAGFAFAGCTLGICAVVGYVNASFPKLGGDTFAVLMFTSRSAIFGMTYIVNNWLALNGVVNFLGWMTGATLILFAAGIPMYIFGKRIRSWTAQSKVLGWACS